MFAVPPVFDGEPYPATVIAMEETELLLLHREDFLRLLRESHEFSFAVIGWMCEMLREKTSVIKNLGDRFARTSRRKCFASSGGKAKWQIRANRSKFRFAGRTLRKWLD